MFKKLARLPCAHVAFRKPAVAVVVWVSRHPAGPQTALNTQPALSHPQPDSQAASAYVDMYTPPRGHSVHSVTNLALFRPVLHTLVRFQVWKMRSMPMPRWGRRQTGHGKRSRRTQAWHVPQRQRWLHGLTRWSGVLALRHTTQVRASASATAAAAGSSSPMETSGTTAWAAASPWSASEACVRRASAC